MKIRGSSATFALRYYILLRFALKDDAVDRHSVGTCSGGNVDVRANSTDAIFG
jgi:hypothetical protein